MLSTRSVLLRGSALLRTTVLRAASTTPAPAVESSTPGFDGQPDDLFHRHSTHYYKNDHSTLAKLDTGVKVSELPHRPIESLSDRVASGLVWSLRRISYIFFRQKYTHYACLLETVAAVPGMVGGMMNHLRSLRRLERNTHVKKLLDEAENERMHLMTFMELAKPKLWERMFVIGAQGLTMTAYCAFYILSPVTAHRFVGYLEEEAVKSYTEMLDSIDRQVVPNPPAPEIAIKYWNLPKDATLRDVVLVVRADEMDHRDVNHEICDHLKHRQLIADL